MFCLFCVLIAVWFAAPAVAFTTALFAAVPRSLMVPGPPFLSTPFSSGYRYLGGRQIQLNSQINPPDLQPELTTLSQYETPDDVPANNQHNRPTDTKTTATWWKRRGSSIRKFTGGLWSFWKSVRRTLARKAAIVLLCLMTILSSFDSDAWAVTGGRMGGSFGKSSRSSYSAPSRSYSSPGLRAPSTRLYYRAAPRPLPIVISQHHYHTPVYGPTLMPRREFGASDLIFVTGAGVLIAYGVKNALEQEPNNRGGTLGPGVSVARLTVALSVPDVNAPDSILNRLHDMAQTARTDTREGVQRLIAQVALELLRQERSIRSAEARSQHYRLESEAEKQYLRASVQQRSKFDKETVNKFGSEDQSRPSVSSGIANDLSQATEAVVTILVSIEGDSTQLPEIKSRRDLREALNQLASDVQVDDCLSAGEVLWAPEERGDRLSQDDIYVDYPSLYPL